VPCDRERPAGCGGCGDRNVPLVFLSGEGWSGLGPGAGLCRECCRAPGRAAEREAREAITAEGHARGHWSFQGNWDVVYITDSDSVMGGEKG
jgi:hypothetical protein